MTRYAGKPGPRSGAGRYLLVALALACSAYCAAQTTPTAATAASAAVNPAAAAVAATVAAPPVETGEPCSAVRVDCNARQLPTAPEPTLLDPATAKDQAQRAQMQANQTQAEQDLARRAQLEREHPGTIFVFGDHPQTHDESVRSQFARILGQPPSSTLSSTSYSPTGGRIECVNACYGPMCCVGTASAGDPSR